MTSSTEASTSNPVDTDQQNVANTADGSVAVDDLGSPEAFLAAVDATIKYFNDGDIVSGTVVKVDRDEVLLDIGYKTEGVIDCDIHHLDRGRRHLQGMGDHA